MPRIPEPEIDRIKSSTDLAALVRSRGIELRKHGNGHMIGTCPFHDDDEPSFIVTPAKGLFHCMGCGAAGNPIQFVEKFDGVSFRHAFELLNEGKAAFTKPREGVSKRCTAHRLKPSVTLDQNDTELMEQTVSFYHERLLSSSGEPARKYLEKRGLYDPEAIRHFKIGYSDRTFGFHIPSRDKQEGREIRIRLQNTGLFRKSGHEHFNGCLVMPIFDPVTGNVLEMYGRKINRHQTKGTPMHLYLPGPHAGIWNTETIFPQPSTRNKEPRTNHEVILCEAPLDALTLWVNGFKNVTFIYGTEGFPDYMLQTFIKNRIKTIRLAYDSDNAGNRAAERDAKRLTAHGIETFRVKLPWGMDINKYAVTVTPAAKSLRVAIDSAEWLRPDIAHTRPPVINNKSLAANNLTANQKTTSRNPAQKKMILSPMILSNSPEPTPTLLRQGDYHTITFGKREYRIGGLDKNNSLEVLKVAVRIRHGEDFHLDSFDMTRDNERRRFIERSSEETGLEKELIKRDLGRLLLALEETQQERITAALGKDESGKRKAEMTSAEKSEAMAFLKSPDLADRITETFDACGLAGEESNRLAAYLACTSRKLDKPLAVIIQSISAAGKSCSWKQCSPCSPKKNR